MTAASYLDKVFQTPEFIWQDGICNLEAVEKSLLEQSQSRLALLAQDAPTLPDVVRSDQVEVSSAPTEPDPLDSITTDFKAEMPEPTAELSKTQSVTRSAVVPLATDVWNSNEPINYHAQFKIGTAAKTFYLDIDSGSSLLWLQALLSSRSVPITDQNMYDPSLSTTANALNQTHNTSYGDGSRVSVSLYRDTIAVGQITGENQLLGAADIPDLSKVMGHSKSNGLIGLGFPLSSSRVDASTDGTSMNYVQSLQASGKLKYASFSMIGPRVDPVDAIEIDKNHVLQPRGHFVMGSVDSSWYSGSIAWCPTVPNTDRWTVKLDEVRINGVTRFTNQQALIDTGTAYMLVSPDNLKKVANAIQDARIITRKSTLFAYPETSLQTVSFVLGGREFLLHRGDFTLGRISEDLGKDGGIAGQTGLVASICSIASPWPFPENLWVLGGIFLDNVVTIFDFAERKLGFADISEADLDDQKFAAAV